MRLIVLSLALATLCVYSVSAVTFFDVVVQEWETWKLTHNKTYASEEENRLRLKIFMENAHKISKHNSRAQKGHHSFYMKMNHFGDLLPHEFTTRVNGYLGAKKFKGATYIPAENVVVPNSMDWREKGAVTPVKNQGQCGSCWSFSTTGAVEGQDFRKKGKLISLSEQNLVDCSSKYGNQGCNGGLMDQAFKYIKENKGIDTEESYPYEGVQRKCRYKPSNKGGWDTGFVDIESGSEEQLTHALATIGPIAVAIDASNESFQFYSHGVYNEDNCSSQSLDHGVLAVGYSTDPETGEDYYIVKNSWSENWGIGGYIHMARNKNNMCGIATQASYPLV